MDEMTGDVKEMKQVNDGENNVPRQNDLCNNGTVD